MKQHGQFIFLLVVLIIFFAFSGFVLENPPDGNKVSRSEDIDYKEEPETSPSQNGGSVPGNVAPPAEETQLSPARRVGSVYISSISRFYGDRPAEISLRSNLQEGETVNIDDWEIKGNDGRIFIPEAVRYYQFADSNKSEEIILGPGHSLTIYLGAESPISKNFQLNKCTGYLNTKYDFMYSLPKECPLPDKQDYKYLSGECQNYIRRMRRCELPDPNVTNSFRGESGNECRAFVNDFFSIGNCYDLFEKDDDFLKGKWRVWINREGVFDPQHDWLKLVNREGKVIDEYTY